MFLKNISIIYRHSASVLQKRLKEPPLNNTEQSILLFLRRKDGVNQHAIAEYFQFNKTTVAKTLSSLEDYGFIRRETNCESKREKCVYLTDEGRSALCAIVEVRKVYEEELMANFSQEEQALFDSISEKVAVKAWELNQKITE